MAKVSLRAYNREIEKLIEGGQLDEAVVHCQYIFKAFPMHVETYRLLGKAFLEARRHADAADIFQRVLMAVPDDFVAHVGMSIIRDNEGRLDDAIWHMERAFEVQPSNPAIQGELRRLYGRRDGIEPPKIRLSRDALANMYSQGELFNQAIAEIRAVLAEDLNRPDLQVMLARAYYRSGQKVEAAEMSAALLKKYPYCMDALRVLVDVLPDAVRSENIQVYRRRLRLLDPYSSFATDSVFMSDQVADTAVKLQRLDYGTGAAPGLPQPDWASSLGIKLAGEKSTELWPDRMRTEKTTKPLPPFIAGTPESSSAPAAESGPVPDWMRAAGWQESTGTAHKGSMDSGEEPSAEPILHADIPDWLKAMAPPEVTGVAKAESEAISTEASSSMDAGALPDWLTDLGAGVAAEAAAAPERAQSEEQAVTPEQAQTEEQPVSLESAAREPTESQVSAVPGPEGELFQPSGQVRPLDIGDEALGWLEGLAARQGAKPEELLTNPQERSEEMPEWLRQTSEQPPVPLLQEPVTTPSEKPPVEPFTPLAEELLPTYPPVTDEIASMPEEIPPIQPSMVEETQPVSTRDDTLAWLEQLSAEQGEKLEEESSAVSPPPELVPATPGQASEEDISITSWLHKLDAAEAVGRLPPASTGAEQPAVPLEELPDWLKDLDNPLPAPESTKADEGEELPAWEDENAPVSEQAAPTIPEEWVPAERPAESTTQPGGPVVSAVEPVSPAPANVPAPAAEASADAGAGLLSAETPAQPPIVKTAGILTRVPPQDKDAETLSGAQAALEGHSLGDAMKEYGKLIKKGHLLDEVIHDLREAIYRYPVDAIVWQTLGDAYMRANRLQDALDAYTKAEELIR